MRKKYKTYLLQATLFIITVITTTFAGMQWMGIQEELSWESFAKGFLFSIPFLGILTVHEFGHYITARLYKVKVTLPYYIPFFHNTLLPGNNYPCRPCNQDGYLEDIFLQTSQPIQVRSH